jgi:hypothetical protein
MSCEHCSQRRTRPQVRSAESVGGPHPRLVRSRFLLCDAEGCDAHVVGGQTVFDKAGNPNLVANFAPDGGLAKPTWSSCPLPDVSGAFDGTVDFSSAIADPLDLS